MDGIMRSLSQPYWICFSNCHVANHHFLQEFTFWKGTTNLRRVSMDPSMFFLCWDGSSRQNLGKKFFCHFIVAPFLQQIFSLFQMNEDERSLWMSCSVSLSLPTKQVTGLDRLIRLVLCDSAIFLWEATNSFNHIKKYFQPHQQIFSTISTNIFNHINEYVLFFWRQQRKNQFPEVFATNILSLIEKYWFLFSIPGMFRSNYLYR